MFNLPEKNIQKAIKLGRRIERLGFRVTLFVTRKGKKLDIKRG